MLIRSGLVGVDIGKGELLRKWGSRHDSKIIDQNEPELFLLAPIKDFGVFPRGQNLDLGNTGRRPFSKLELHHLP